MTALELQISLFLFELLLAITALAAVFALISWINTRLGRPFAWIALVALVTVVIWLL